MFNITIDEILDGDLSGMKCRNKLSLKAMEQKKKFKIYVDGNCLRNQLIFSWSLLKMILLYSVTFQYLIKFALNEVTLNVVTAGNIRYEKNSKLSFPGGYPEDKTFNQYFKVSWF